LAEIANKQGEAGKLRIKTKNIIKKDNTGRARTIKEGRKMKNVKKFISLVLIVTMVTLNLPLTVFAGENEALNRFKEYNKEKVSLYPYLVEMYKSGSETSVGPSQYVELHDGRTIYVGREPELTNTKYKISWRAFTGERALTETELYELLGSEDKIEEAVKANKRGKTLFYGGLIALGAGFLWLTASGNKSGTSSASPSTSAALLVAGGAFTAYFGNRMIAAKSIDYIDMYKMVQKHNRQLLAGYFNDIDLKKEMREIDKIYDLNSLYQYEYGDLEIKDEYRDKDFAVNKIEKGMAKEEVLAVCGSPYVTDSYNSLTSWEYVIENTHRSDKMFDFGRLTGESFNYTIYTLYFENDKLVDWTEQNYTS
jgi:hypothetical protein